MFTVSRWIWLWIPIGARSASRSWSSRWSGRRDRVRAVRAVGMTLAVSRRAARRASGAATPAISRPSPPATSRCRGDAVAAFVETLTGRLAGAGLALILVGLADRVRAGQGRRRPRATAWRRYRAYWDARSGRARGGASPAASRSSSSPRSC